MTAIGEAEKELADMRAGMDRMSEELEKAISELRDLKASCDVLKKGLRYMQDQVI